eukprot:11535464-Ditylum_brightwellii.AAC.1
MDKCVFYREDIIFICYVDDRIFSGPDPAGIDQAIVDMKAMDLDIEDRGELQDYLGINISKVGDKIKLSQPHIIDQIQSQIGLNPRKHSKLTPAPSTKILRWDQQAPAFDKRFHYRFVIGK